ncbi:MAG: GTP-binding protein [Candidatus ainarchaeum sp.]|nr:GTP-binding protein [Candidatus ainarchaeum sp.]
MSNTEEKIMEIEAEIKKTQKNKATEYHIGLLKAKIAKLRKNMYAPSGTGKGGGFDVKKDGDATVVFVGFPSVGKSTLLNKLTNAKSEVAAYEFTTLNCIPGMLRYKDARIQLLDLPGIIKGAMEGKGRGKEIISVARNADLVMIIVDSKHPEHYGIILNELYGFGIRLDKEKPDVQIKKGIRGGIQILSSNIFLKNISKNEIIAVLNEYGIHNGTVVLREKVDLDRFIDALESSRVYIPSLIVANKADLGIDKSKFNFEYVSISAELGEGVEELKEKIYNKLKFIRIYTKRKREKADMEEALILIKGQSVRDVCRKLHRELEKTFKYALIWGKSVKHPGQRVGIDHIIEDKDVVQIVTK